jgi:hypothetical protein
VPPSWRHTALIAIAGAVLWVNGAAAQPNPGASESLKQRVEQQFDVLVTRDVVALRPRTAMRDVRWIEITDRGITIDGTTVTGSELRDRLGAAADLVLSVSYLDQAERARLFSSESPRPAVPVEADDRPAPPPAADGGATPRQRTRDEIVRVGGSVTVGEDEVVGGDVVAIGGSVSVRGEVQGEVVAVGGALDLGPRAVVSGDVTVVGGTLTRAEGAVVRGEVHEVNLGMLNFDGFWKARGSERWRDNPWWTWRTPSALERLMGTLVRFAMYCLLAAIVVLLGRDHVDRIGRLAAAESLKAGAIGVFSQLLFVPLLVIAVILLLITIIGIPFIALIPFGVVALVIIAFIGFTAVANALGRIFGARFGLTTSDPYVTTFTGVLIILAPILLARIVAVAIGGLAYPMTFVLSMVGSVGEYLAWTVGFGAMALAKFSQVRTMAAS